MLLIGLKNTVSQTLLTNELINIGIVDRKYCKKICGLTTFSNGSTSLRLNQEGIYHVTATLVGTGTVAGDVTVQLNANGTPIAGAFSTETITTPATEFRTFVIDTYILVNSSSVLRNESINAQTLTLTNTGVGATFTTIALNVDKVV